MFFFLLFLRLLHLLVGRLIDLLKQGVQIAFPILDTFPLNSFERILQKLASLQSNSNPQRNANRETGKVYKLGKQKEDEGSMLLSLDF